MNVLAIDPGPTESAWVEFDGERVLDFGIDPNIEVLDVVDNSPGGLVIEGVACYGMPVGKEVFDTCIWIGRFIQVRSGTRHPLVYRPDVKLHLCHSMRAKDPMIRQALIDRFGPGKDKAIGKKKSPGPLYGISSHCWSALAVAVYWHDTNHVCVTP